MNDRHHEREYERIKRETEHTDLPAWSELTEKQREDIRIENRRYAQELADFGRAIFEESALEAALAPKEQINAK